MLNLITSFYLPDNEERKNELTKSLTKNIECPYIKKIHLYVDDQKTYIYLINKMKDKERKIKIVGIGKQPKYNDFFWYCNTNLQNEICMISNTDIWLKHINNPMILTILMQKNIIFALTRHEYNMKSPLINKYCGSHDVFIFRAPIKKKIIMNINHPQNLWGSENKVINELISNGYTILNPCKQIVIVHEHKSNYREKNRKSIIAPRIIWSDMSYMSHPCIIGNKIQYLGGKLAGQIMKI